MSNLIKIKDVSDKYDITARTLRYYEDMGFIKDIQRIFNASGSEVVLEVLGKKMQRIDDEVALLHELKEIVQEFISEIERIDFVCRG